MTIFDLLFVFLVLVAAAACGAALIAAVRGRRRWALRILRRAGLAALGYIAIVAITGALAPQRVLHVGEPWCFDDWCLRVEAVDRAPAPPAMEYRVSLRVFSRALRVSQSAKGAWVYLIDRHGNRYSPKPDRSAVPLDVRLAPGESVALSRVFRIPENAGPMGLITGHGPVWFPALIIADEASVFHRRTFVRLE